LGRAVSIPWGAAELDWEFQVSCGCLCAPGGAMPAAAEGLEVQAAEGLEAWERRLWGEGCRVVAGTDEAGRGPLAGPVVAGAFAVLAHDDEEVLRLLEKVADSKQMTASEREEVFEELTDPRFEGRTVWAVAEASVTEIDQMNILRAALLAMARAVQALKQRPDCVLVDGCNRPPELLAPGEQWTRGSKKAAEEAKNQPKLSKWFTLRAPPAAVAAPWRPGRVEAVIEGDGRVPCISAASVLAKVHRDRLMAELDQRFPAYGFAAHKGYGTADHLEAIRTHGVCPEHRRSFGPVREALGGPEPVKRPLSTASQEAEEEAGGDEAALPAGRGAHACAPTATPPQRRGIGLAPVAPAGQATAAPEETPQKRRRLRMKCA